MSFFFEPEKASCKVYEGRTCVESLLNYVTKLPDEIAGDHNKWKEALVIDLHKINKNNHLEKFYIVFASWHQGKFYSL